MKIYVINGPNLNMLGIREPGHYGRASYGEVERMIEEHCRAKDVVPVIYQSNHEGALVDKIQEAFFEGADGIVINPGAYTHTSIAILDAVKATMLPTVEIHISKVEEREAYRQISYVREACIGTVTGRGIDGYKDAIDLLIDHIRQG
ncbi:MAG: 3-dehydroquinate dehydratase [Clostridia bacterium]|nr:3-dehydroquinate dehydratase [Clostridia bacterium]